MQQPHPQLHGRAAKAQGGTGAGEDRPAVSKGGGEALWGSGVACGPASPGSLVRGLEDTLVFHHCSVLSRNALVSSQGWT